MTQVIYAWVLDGIDSIFVSDEDLDDAWAIAQGFLTTKVGLRLPSSLPCRTNLRSLMLEQTPGTIVVDDLDDTLAALFGTNISESDDLITTIEAPEDPAPASVWGKHLGTERIGPAGQRRVYSAVPGFAVGLRHLGQNEAYANGGAATPVGDVPVAWEGRRCAFYRVEYDEAAGAWQSLADARRVWWGTLRGQGHLLERSYTFGVLGPDSWLGGNLGTGNFETPIRALPITDLVDAAFAGPTMARASLDIVRLDTPEIVFRTYLIESDPDGTLNMGTVSGYTAVAAAVNTFLDQVVASTDNGLAYNDNADGNDISHSTLEGSDGITIRWLRGETAASGDPFVGAGDPKDVCARLRLILHESVWKLLGYDVIQQVNTQGGLDAVDHADQYGRFSPVEFPSGYYQGLFYAANPKAMKASDDNDFAQLVRDDYNSGGFPRRWPPLYPGGTSTWSGLPGQEFQFGTPNEVLLAGSLARPLLADPADSDSAFELGGGVGAVNRSIVLLLEGPYRRRGDQDQNDPAAGYAFDISRERKEGATKQPIRACWRATPGGLVTTDSDGLPRLVVQEWLDPRLVGLDYPRIDGTWGGHRNPPGGAAGIDARPLLVFDYSDAADKTTTVMRRIITTTGTAGGWFQDAGLTTPLFGLGAPAAFLDAGANDDGGDVPSDAESATMGLGVPSSMVADHEVWAEVGSIPGVHLSRCKAVAGVVAPAREFLTRLLAPMGIAMGLSGGKYTPFNAWSFPTPDEAAGTITPESYGLATGKPPNAGILKQGMRKWSPIDLAIIRGRIEPVGGGYFRIIKRAASDRGAQFRAQQITQNVNGDHLVHPLLPIQGGSWQTDIPTRWRDAFAFWGARNTTAKLPLHAADGLDFWPGDGLLITDPWLLNTLGSYGVSVAAVRVIGRDFNPAAEVITLEVMLAAETEFRMYAPAARAIEYDETGPFRLLCVDNVFEDNPDRVDVAGFAEPSYSTEGGDADLEVFEFDGSTWNGGIFGVVSSVDSTPGSASITLTGALTGATWNSDRHHVVVLREWGAQSAAWVKRWHAPICAKGGTHTGAQPGIKWRQL